MLPVNPDAAALISAVVMFSFSTVEQLMRLADGEKAATDEVLKSLEEAFWDSIEHQGIKR